MHILITNDDGVQHPGLLALVQAARNFGDVTVLAPDKNWSACGHVKSLHKPLRIKEVELADGSKAYTSDGAPSDCVALALLGFTEPVDLVLTGINPYANVGDDLTYSGTVTSAMEAVIGGIPGIAFSLDSLPEDTDRSFDVAREVIVEFLQKYLFNGIRKDIVLSVNIPFIPKDQIKGTRITRMGKRIYKDQLVIERDEKGKHIYMIGGEFPDGHKDEGTEILALSEGFIAITPLKLDLTDHDARGELGTLDW